MYVDIRSHTGSILTIGEGYIASGSTKQKCNAHSSKESELNSTDDRMSKVTLTKKFLEAQNYKIKSKIIFQDNKSAIKLMRNG